jgi:hypothetical protein
MTFPEDTQHLRIDPACPKRVVAGWGRGLFVSAVHARSGWIVWGPDLPKFIARMTPCPWSSPPDGLVN